MATSQPLGVDQPRQDVRARVRRQAAAEAAAAVAGGVLGFVGAVALPEGADGPGLAFFFACCGACLALLASVLVLSISNSARGAVRHPLVQALPAPRRRQTSREIRAYVAGGPPPTVDVATARAVALAVCETRWLVGLFVAVVLLQFGFLGVAGWFALPLVLSVVALVLGCSGFLGREWRAAEAFLDRHPEA